MLDDIIATILANPKYRTIDPGLVRQLAERELAQNRSPKEVVKQVRSKLHQVGAVYLDSKLDFSALTSQVDTLPGHDSDALKAFSRSAMQLHASTRERLPILETFYPTVLAGLGPIHSLADYACGLNPLTYPWLPLAPDAQIWAGDIFTDLAAFLNRYFLKAGWQGQAVVNNLTSHIPTMPVQLGLLLKALPCLEQLDKNLPARLLAELPGDYLLVTFPAHSLSGRSKGMVRNYADRFEQQTAGKGWQIQRFEFPGELAFLVQR